MGWTPVPVLKGTILDSLNGNLSNFSRKHKNCLPDFGKSNALLIGSDYSGDSSACSHQVYSFLVVSSESWAQWEEQRTEIRRQFLSDGRRLSFKQLSDNQRQNAFMPILNASNNLNGLLFAIALNKKSEPLFHSEVPLDLNNPDFFPYKKWKKDVLLKAFIIVHFLSFFVAGLARENQDILWFTDEDDIVANDERTRELTNLFGWILNQYLMVNLGNIRCGTARCDNGSRQIEDLIAIPDFVAGALAEQMIVKSDLSIEGCGNAFFMHHPSYSDKTKKITWWFSQNEQSLKRLLFVIDPGSGGGGNLVSFFHFHNQC